MARKYAPIHPGKILREDFMLPMELSANRLAKALVVPTNRITSIVNGTRSITGDTALRLAAVFGTSAELWANLQTHYDLEVAQMKAGRQIARSVKPIAAALER